MNYLKILKKYQLDIKKMELLAQETFGMQMCKGIVWTNMIQFKGPAKQQIKLRNLRHCFKNKWSKISQNRVKLQYKILEFANMINYIWVMHKCMFLHSLQFLENAPTPHFISWFLFRNFFSLIFPGEDNCYLNILEINHAPMPF